MWELERAQRFKSRLRKVEKKHRREARAVIDNLDTYLVSLNQGVKPMQMVKHSFVHNEQMGVHAIDQSPLRKGAKAIRLYVYPDPDTSRLHVITMGDKDQQSDDVRECCEYVRELRKGEGGANAKKDDQGAEE